MALFVDSYSVIRNAIYFHPVWRFKERKLLFISEINYKNSFTICIILRMRHLLQVFPTITKNVGRTNYQIKYMNLTLNNWKWYGKGSVFLYCVMNLDKRTKKRLMGRETCLLLQFLNCNLKCNMHFYLWRKEKDLKTRSPQFLKFGY